MPFSISEQEISRYPEFYEQKANQLRLQNQILRRQLEGNVQGGTIKKTHSPIKVYSTVKNPVNYAFHNNVPVQQVIYNPVTEPIRPPSYTEYRPSFENFPQKARTQVYHVAPERQQRYTTGYVGQSGDYERKIRINEVQGEIIELQARGYKLERQANRLSSYIKQDLRDFVRDSNIKKQCSYRQKYLRAIANRPRYFRFNM